MVKTRRDSVQVLLIALGQLGQLLPLLRRNKIVLVVQRVVASPSTGLRLLHDASLLRLTGAVLQVNRLNERQRSES